MIFSIGDIMNMNDVDLNKLTAEDLIDSIYCHFMVEENLIEELPKEEEQIYDYKCDTRRN